MAFSQNLLRLPLAKPSPSKISPHRTYSAFPAFPLERFSTKSRQFQAVSRRSTNLLKARAESGQVVGGLAVDAFQEVKHVLLPITDEKPYLSEGTRQAAATTTALAKKYGAEITVVVINEKEKDSIPEHDAKLSSIRWHLSEG
ncbi:uncharacterized protein [Aristolochia californica]